MLYIYFSVLGYISGVIEDTLLIFIPSYFITLILGLVILVWISTFFEKKVKPYMNFSLMELFKCILAFGAGGILYEILLGVFNAFLN